MKKIFVKFVEVNTLELVVEVPDDTVINDIIDKLDNLTLDWDTFQKDAQFQFDTDITEDPGGDYKFARVKTLDEFKDRYYFP